jgi:RimJ/RimL family protein N-acetyltransferase
VPTSDLPTTIPVPVLETTRLVLRGHRREDYEDCARMWGDADVVRHIGARPFTPEETWARVLRYVGHWCWQGYGFWAVVEKASGRFVGDVGFADFKRASEPAMPTDPEAGWALAPWCHGHGYATEAVQAALTWAQTGLPVPRAVCLINPDNRASVRVADKCGFQLTGEPSYKGERTLLFTRSLSRSA